MRRILQIVDNEGGSSAVEFAILAPVLALVCLGIINGWSLASFTLSMRAGVGAAASLYMLGADDDAVVRELTLESWQNQPDDADVSIGREYRCGTDTVSASTLCSDSKSPATYITVAATGTWVAPFEVDFLATSQQMTHQQVIRVR